VQDIGGATEVTCNSMYLPFDAVECDDALYQPGCHAEIER